MNLLVSEISKLSFSRLAPLILAYVPQVPLPHISQRVAAQLLVRLLATLSNLLVMASVPLPLVLSVVKDAPIRQQNALCAKLDPILLVQLAIQPAIIPSQQKHLEESSIVKLLVQGNMSGGIRAAPLLVLTRRPMVLTQWLEQQPIHFQNAHILVA